MNHYNISGLENVLAGVEEPSNQGPQGPPEDDRGSGAEVPRGGSAGPDPDVSLDAPHPGPQAATPEPGLEHEAAEPVPQCSVGPDPEAIPGPGPSSNQGPQQVFKSVFVKALVFGTTFADLSSNKRSTTASVSLSSDFVIFGTTKVDFSSFKKSTAGASYFLFWQASSMFLNTILIGGASFSVPRNL